MGKRERRSVSIGTVVVLTMTALVLVGFLALFPSFTGHQDIRTDVGRLAVAVDQSLSQLSASADFSSLQQPRNTVLPPENLATTAPAILAASAKPVQVQPTPTPVSKRSFSLCAAGSVVWNDAVRKSLMFGDEPRFDILTDQLTGALQADLSIATLEHTLKSDAKLSNLNMPAEILLPLQKAGINTLSLGHINILNNGIAGAQATVQAVEQAGFQPIGIARQGKPNGFLSNQNGVSVALLCYQNEVSATGRKQTTEAERDEALSPIDVDAIAADIRTMRNNGAQVVILSLCWGKADANAPSEKQVEQAQAMADAGADIILGTRSGALQPVTVLSANRGDGVHHPVLCAYSLGNLFCHNRESGANLASILLRANVVYDAQTQRVAFEDLAYTPTYDWRGKQDGKTLVRVLVNDNQTYPDFVGEEQKKVMKRCFKTVTDVMADTGIPMQ